MPICSVAG